jgi:caudovirus prohead protease
MARIRLTNSSLNAYGTRILTSGVDLTQYERNPVLLYMHERGNIIGKMKDLKVEGDDITGEPEFDEASECSIRCKKQLEFGSLRMSSVGIDIVEMSADKKYLLPGQTRETITKSKLVEVSLVDVGANDEAMVLYRNGQRLNLSSGTDEAFLPALLTASKQTNHTDMNETLKKEVAVQLGLSAEATADEVLTAAKAKVEAQKQEIETLKGEIEHVELSAVTDLVDEALAAKKIPAEKRDYFIELGKKVGSAELSQLLGSMNASVKLTDVVRFASEGGTATEYKKLSDVPDDKIIELRTNEPAVYCKLYKAEYGVECELDN